MNGTTALGTAGRLDVMVLDEAPGGVKSTVLGQLPPPLRLLYRTVWRRRYQHGPRWQSDSASQMAATDRTNKIIGVAR